MNRFSLLALMWILMYPQEEVLAQTLEEEILIESDQRPSENRASTSFATEKEKLLNQLKSEIEANVLPADVKKIRGNISKLGSYNSKWSAEAAEFLTTNALLVELFLYDYVRVKNKRLNSKIIDVLMQFDNFQFPLAPLYFSSDLVVNEENLSGVLPLMKKVIIRHPDFFDVYWSWLSTQDLSENQKLDFLRMACKSGSVFSLDLRSQIEALSQASQPLWAEVFLGEVQRCLKGL
ncbi:MAG: hypothetical protein ACO3LE_07620 [Bdellovibrionota bacterium]